MSDASVTYLTLRPPHRTFLFWAVLVMVLTSLAVGVIGLREDGWTAGTTVRALFIVAMVVFWVGAMRSGTTVDREGLTLRRALTTRRLPWSRVERLGTDQPGADARRVTASVGGSAVVLPGVLVGELDRLSAAASAAPRPGG